MSIPRLARLAAAVLEELGHEEADVVGSPTVGRCALNEEMTEHQGHEKNRTSGDRDSFIVRKGTRPNTVLTHAHRL
jgi:hypothetical protein